MRHTARATATALALCALHAASAAATPDARMSAAFSPERLGAPTALSVGLSLAGAGAQPPAPIGGIDIHYPQNLGLITSNLGLASCPPEALEIEGPSTCPANSRMGAGSALVEFQVQHETRDEQVRLALVAGPSPDGRLHILISATGEYPVFASIVMSAVVLPDELQVTVPPIPGLPEGPDVSLISMHVTIGGNLTYYEHAHGRTIAYRPRGISLPPSCPRGGFRFATSLSFLDGTRSSVGATVACPPRRARPGP